MHRLRERSSQLGLGLGLRGPHFEALEASPPRLGFLELLSENWMDAPARRHRHLETLLPRYPVVLHGVSLSIGSTDPLRRTYLLRLKPLIRETNPLWVSDHLAWTGVRGINTHDLLPLPATEEALRHVVARAREVSEILERPLVLENPSAYLEFPGSMSESEFVARIAEEADIGLLLDVNNVWVSSRNLGFDPLEYVDRMPADRIVQIHLAGHEDLGTHLLDTHGKPVSEEVWQLYARLIRRIGPRATLLEWDADVPPLASALQELKKAERWLSPELLYAMAG